MVGPSCLWSNPFKKTRARGLLHPNLRRVPFITSRYGVNVNPLLFKRTVAKPEPTPGGR